MSFLKSSLKSFIWNVLGAGLGFIFQMVAAKILGAEVFGKANYYLGYCSTITIFICFGLQTYLPKYISTVKNKKNLFSDVFWNYTILFMFSNIIIFIILRAQSINSKQIILISILAYLTTLSEIILSYNIATGNAAIGMFNRKFLYSALNVILFTLACLFMSREYYLYIGVMILSYILTTLPFIIKNVNKFGINILIIRHSLGFYGIQLIYGVYLSYSKVLQKSFGTFETVAVLSISLTLGGLVAMLGDNFAKVSMPSFSKYWTEGNFDKLKEVYMTTTRINCYLVLPIALTLVLNASRMLNLLGKGYNGGEFIFILIMLSQFINSFTGPNGTLLVMTNYTKFEIVNGIIKLITSIIAIVLLGNKYIWAVAFSLVISEVVVNICKTIQVKKNLDIFPYSFKNLIYIIILVIIEFLIIDGISKINNLLVWIVITGVFTVIIYGLTFTLSPIKQDREFVKNALLKLKRK